MPDPRFRYTHVIDIEPGDLISLFNSIGLILSVNRTSKIGRIVLTYLQNFQICDYELFQTESLLTLSNKIHVE